MVFVLDYIELITIHSEQSECFRMITGQNLDKKYCFSLTSNIEYMDMQTGLQLYGLPVYDSQPPRDSPSETMGIIN